MPIDLVTSAHRYLVNAGVRTALVTAGLLGTDSAGGPFVTGWLFSGDITGDPYRPVEGTGKCAVVLYSYDHWSPSTAQHSARYPRLNVAIYADVTRDGSGNITHHDAEDKTERIFLQLNPYFHDNGNKLHAFDDLRVISALQSSGLSIMNIPNGDGAVRGVVTYDISLD